LLRPHSVNMKHLGEALTSIINKQSSEEAIKRFFDIPIQGGRGVSKQADLIKEAIGDIISDFFKIKTTYRYNGTDNEVIVEVAQVKDLLIIFVILAQLPKDVDAGYQGRIRELKTCQNST
jgi:hypothetical protein